MIDMQEACSISLNDTDTRNTRPGIYSDRSGFKSEIVCLVVGDFQENCSMTSSGISKSE